jgi:hypothetical protein
MSMAYDVDLVRSLVAEAELDEVGCIKGRVHIPLVRRPGLEEYRRERRRRLIDARLAEVGVAAADLARAEAAASRPAGAVVEAPPLYHPCDVLALRTRVPQPG